MSRLVVADGHPPAAVPAHQQACQQRRAMPCCSLKLGPCAIGCQAFLIEPVPLGRDVGGAMAFQEYGTILGSADGASRGRPARDLLARIGAAMPPAIVARIDGMMQQVLQCLPIGTPPFQLPTIGPVMR